MFLGFSRRSLLNKMIVARSRTGEAAARGHREVAGCSNDRWTSVRSCRYRFAAMANRSKAQFKLQWGGEVVLVCSERRWQIKLWCDMMISWGVVCWYTLQAARLLFRLGTHVPRLRVSSKLWLAEQCVGVAGTDISALIAGSEREEAESPSRVPRRKLHRRERTSVSDARQLYQKTGTWEDGTWPSLPTCVTASASWLFASLTRCPIGVSSRTMRW